MAKRHQNKNRSSVDCDQVDRKLKKSLRRDLKEKKAKQQQHFIVDDIEEDDYFFRLANRAGFPINENEFC